jgi:GntR family carbon starvation induced transcriptional regulator
VREALNRLTAQGFVLQTDQRGFTATPLDVADLTDLTLARAAVNEAALRDAIAHGDSEWEEGVLLAHHRLSRTPRGKRETSPEWEERHHAFHEALLAGCRSRRLRLYAAQLFIMCDRYRRVSRVAPGARNVAGEHVAILQAALGRDADRAVILLEQHVQRTDALVRQALAK